MAASTDEDGFPAHKNGEDRHLGLSVKITPDGPSVCHCFGCHTGGTLLAVFKTAQEFVGGFDLALAFIEENDKGGLVQALARLRKGPSKLTSKGRRPPSDLDKYVAKASAAGVPLYLIDRGIIRSDVERWRIGFDPDLSPVPWKGAAGAAVFPVWDEHEKLVGAARRTIHPNVQPKFFDTPGVWKSEVFYGEHAIDRTLEHAVLVEGVLGKVFASRVLPNVLGMLGATQEVGEVRLGKLIRWCRSVTLMLDADQPGRNAVDGYFDARGKWVRGLREQLRPHFVVKIARLPTEWGGRVTKDPADYGHDLGPVLLNAVKSAEYL